MNNATANIDQPPVAATVTDQLPPHDLDAESCAIGSMGLCGDDTALFAQVRRLLWPGAFYLEDHKIIFRALCEMADAMAGVDAVTLRAHLAKRGLLDAVGGTEFLVRLFGTVPSASHGPHYAKIVADLARRREAIGLADSLAKRLYQPMHGEDASAAVIQRAIDQLWRVATSGTDLKVWKLEDVIERFIESRKHGETVAVECGIGEIDRDYCGVFRAGGYTLVAARPSMGKSTFIRDRLYRWAQAGTAVGLIAVEEDAEKIAGNTLSAESSIENSRVAYGDWSDHDWRSIGDAVDRIRGLPYFGTDTALNLPDVLAAAELLVTQHRCRVIAVDHVHLIGGSRGENREQQISEISNALKALFKRMGVVGIVAAQLNRPPKESGEPPKPQLTDLRGSGALEEHADSVLMLHRRDYYHRGEDNYPADALCQVFIRKNRNGRVGEVVLKADLQHQRFTEIEPHVPEEIFR